jgi:hypothetical protein
MEPVDPLAIQVGQRGTVLGLCQCLGLEPSHLRGRGRLRIDSPSTHDLAHHRIEGQAVGVVHILVSGQSPEHRLPEQPVKPVDRVLAAPGVAQCFCRQIGQPERVIQLAHHQQAAVGTELRTSELHMHPAVELDPICPLRTRTLWVIHQTRPSRPSTP